MISINAISQSPFPAPHFVFQERSFLRKTPSSNSMENDPFESAMVSSPTASNNNNNGNAGENRELIGRLGNSLPPPSHTNSTLSNHIQTKRPHLPEPPKDYIHVRFLSMKLATVNPRMDFNMEPLPMSKDMFHSRGSLYSPCPSPCGNDPPFQPSNGRNKRIQMDNFGASQVSSFWEDELHSVVQMGFGPGQMQNFQGILPKAQMKVEL